MKNKTVANVLSLNVSRPFEGLKTLIWIIWIASLVMACQNAAGGEKEGEGEGEGTGSFSSWELVREVPLQNVPALEEGETFLKSLENRSPAFEFATLDESSGMGKIRIYRVDTAGSNSLVDSFLFDRGMNGPLIDFDGTTFLAGNVTVSPDQTEVEGRYAIREVSEITEWTTFRASALVDELISNPLGHWFAGNYSSTLTWDTASVLPPPEDGALGYLAFRDLFGEVKWARQLGGQIRGRPRDWSATRLLELTADPAGYAWALWQGRAVDPAESAVILGVNLYDLSGIMMKHFIFRVRPPGEARVDLQLLPGGKLAVVTLGSSPSGGNHILHLFIFDRDGTAHLETSIPLRNGFFPLTATLVDDHAYIIGRAGDQGILLQKIRFR